MYASTRRGRQGVGTGPGPRTTIGPDISDKSVADRVADLSLTVANLTPQVEAEIRQLLDEVLVHGQFTENAFQIVAYACALEKENDARLLALVLDLTLQKINDDSQADVHNCVRLCQIIGTQILPTLQDAKTLDSNGQPIVGITLFRSYLLDRCKFAMEMIWQAKEQATSLLDQSPNGSEATRIETTKWINFMEFVHGLWGHFVLGELIVHVMIEKQLSSAKSTDREINKVIDIIAPGKRFPQVAKMRDRMDTHYSRLRNLAQNHAVSPASCRWITSTIPYASVIQTTIESGAQPAQESTKTMLQPHPLVPDPAETSVENTGPALSQSPKGPLIPTFDPSMLQDGRFHVDAKTPLTVVIAFFTQFAQPPIADLTSELQSATFSEEPISASTMSDVWRATLRRGTHVAVKCVNSTMSGGDKAIKHTVRELAAWSQQQHANILQLLGIALYKGRLAMVSEWMEQGSIVKVVNKHPDVDRYGLCVQVAGVVVWLHNKGLIHGDLKGANILISDSGTPKVTDFGLTVMSGGFLQFSETFEGGGTMRWMAPELFQENARKSIKTDVYALGMTMLEILTGQEPFPEISSPHGIIKAVSVNKQIPKRPDCMTAKTVQNEVFWDAMVKCWVYDPALRATAEEIENLIGSAENGGGLMKSVSAKRGSMCSSCMLA